MSGQTDGPPKTTDEWIDYWVQVITADVWDHPSIETRDEWCQASRTAILCVIRDAGLRSKEDYARLLEKYHRVRENVRNISKVLRERRYTEVTKRFRELRKMYEELTFVAGKTYRETDTFVWFRLTRDEYQEYSRWKIAQAEAKRGVQ